MPKGCKIKAITAQINCFIAFKEFIDSLFLHPMTFERNQVQLELLAEENLYIGIGYNPTMGDVFDGKKLPYVSIKGKLKQLDESINSKEDILLKDIDGVQDHSLENLFDPKTTLSYDSSFADKVYSAIGRKTDETGCYSAPIPCKEGDYFTRTGLGTGIVVVMDSAGNILGDIKMLHTIQQFRLMLLKDKIFISFICFICCNGIRKMMLKLLRQSMYLQTLETL